MYRGIPYPENALKKDLWDIVKKFKTTPKYVTDQIAKEKGYFDCSCCYRLKYKYCIGRS